MELENLETENEEKLTKEEKEQLFNSIVRGQDLLEEIETSRGKFKIKFPRMRDLEKIGRIVATKTNGLPVNSFDIGTYTLMQEVATLDCLVVRGPSWYENAKLENKNFAWNVIPDQEFIQEVYNKVFQFRNNTQKLFEQDTDTENTGLDSSKNTTDSDSPELFDGLSGEV